MNAKKNAQKWKIKKEKQQKEEQSTASINFKTHQAGECEDQIIIPKLYPQFNKNQQILVIECGKDKILVQVNHTHPASAPQQHLIEAKSQISVLKTLLDIQGIQCGATRSFKGEIRILNSNKIPEYSLQIVQFLIKETYFSRRDQYKVMKALRDSVTHVYTRKRLSFDEITIQVYSMMRNNQTVAKFGIIDKNTKVIFRSNCCKLTIGIQLAVQTFQLNEDKQLYIEKMIEFLYVLLQRNHYFNNAHRVTLIFYARCFYPRFKSLKEAYDYLVKQNTTISNQEKYQINFSVALQKDYKGRIYQDVYRRIIWSCDMIDNFRQYFWEKVSQFLFTINWDTSNNQNLIGKFIPNSLGKKIESEEKKWHQNIDKSNLKIKPFLHKLKATLAQSSDSNLFEAISLISEQYRHHYKFRSLNETGNKIIMLSAGNSKYQVDELSYKMAKSYVYLTNISCELVNFSKKNSDPLEVDIICFNKKPIYNSNDKKKLQNNLVNCIQKQVYNSPMSEDMIIWDHFQLKNMIYPEQLIELSPQRSEEVKNNHNCNFQSHFQLKESVYLKPKIDYNIKSKNVSFISVCNMSDSFLYIHEKIYDKMKINRFNRPKTKQKHKLKQIDVFEIDLDKIIIKKNNWNFQQTTNQVTFQLQSYQKYLQRAKNSSKEQKIRQLERVNKNIFKKYNQIKDQKQNNNKFETMSNDQYNINDSRIVNKRKNSESYSSEAIKIFQGLPTEKGKVNIFEATYRNKNHEYNAGELNQNKHKKYITHNKERLKNLYPQSNIHYLMPHFSDQILKKFRAFIRKEYIQEFKQQEDNIAALFQMQKNWKNLCFPLLTPIYTKYKENFKRAQQHMNQGVIEENNGKKNTLLEDQICKLLMKNYQIQQASVQYPNQPVKLSKGQVSCHLIPNGNSNLARSHIIDKQRQEKIIPFMLYRYLCYQDKDCRFCTKYVYFQDKNYYDFAKRIDLQTKTVKIVLGYDESLQARPSELTNTFSGFITEFKREENLSGSFATNPKKQKDPFQDFIKQLNKKYKQLNIELIGKYKPPDLPKKKKRTIIFSKQSSHLYHHESIDVEINVQYNQNSLFQILVSWNLCSSVIVHKFVQNIDNAARKNKLKFFLVTAGNIFNTIWSITTIGQIVFEHKISLELLEKHIIGGGEWLWDSNGYYLHISGIAFIQFKKDKKLILWRDNNNKKRNMDIKKDDSAKQYHKFFIKSAIFDFIGGIINRAITEASICSYKK